MPILPAQRHEIFCARAWRRQPILERGVRAGFNTAPLFDRHHDGFLDAAAGDDLGAALDRGVQQFAEAGFGFVQLILL